MSIIAEQAVKHEDIDVVDLAISTLSGVAGGLIGGKGLNAKSLISEWDLASNGIKRELRRVTTKYASKQIARYTFAQTEIKSAIKIGIGRFALGSIGSALTRRCFAS